MALVKTPLVLLVTWVASTITGTGHARASEIVSAAVVMTILDVLVTVAVERPFVVRRRLASPGGWDFALLPWLASSAVAYAAGIAMLGVPLGLVLATAMTSVEGLEMLWRRAWRPGDTDAEFQEKWARTKELAKETFAPDVAEIRRRLDERAMDGYRRRIAEREAQREQEADNPPRDA
ncbi:hypothetical protein ACR8AY_12495 [Clavibacter sepedonicus]|uniref:hypothetical protein n=1 Tax=Clavibacter TaxID=1573 RepID=UPI001CC26F8D|nr:MULTISPECIES: hypothetical protein [Clavibacter]UUK65215.1 hypothetical protein LRE50_13175 [Clavibacter sepedonicus]